MTHLDVRGFADICVAGGIVLIYLLWRMAAG